MFNPYAIADEIQDLEDIYNMRILLNCITNSDSQCYDSQCKHFDLCEKFYDKISIIWKGIRNEKRK